MAENVINSDLNLPEPPRARLHTIPDGQGCPPPWKKHGRKCYFFSPERESKDWNASRAECTAMDSDLLVIDSKKELSYLLSQSIQNYYLLGLTRSPEEQKWKWINNVEHDPAMFHISGPYRDYQCTVIGYGEVQTAPCGGSTTTQNMCEKAATISNRHL
nr:killer cell lectin-like receptor subfamily B member 1F [Zonotrichia albicollis]